MLYRIEYAFLDRPRPQFRLVGIAQATSPQRAIRKAARGRLRWASNWAPRGLDFDCTRARALRCRNTAELR